MTALTALKPHALLTQALNFLLVLSTAYMLWKGLSVASDSKSPIVVVLSGSMEPAFQRGDLLFLWNRDGLLPQCLTCEFMPWLSNPKIPPSSSPDTDTKSISASTSYTEHKNVRIGEIVVYEVQGKDIPIVHRVVRRYPPLPSRNASKRLKSGEAAASSSASTLSTVPKQNGIRILTKGDNNAADDVELYARGQTLLDRDRDVIGSVVGFVPFVGYGTILLSEYPWLKSVMLGLMGITVVLQRE